VEGSPLSHDRVHQRLGDAQRTPAAIKDIYSDARIPADAYRPTFVKSLAMVPIREAAPIGAIGIYWARQHQASAPSSSFSGRWRRARRSRWSA